MALDFLADVGGLFLRDPEQAHEHAEPAIDKIAGARRRGLSSAPAAGSCQSLLERGDEAVDERLVVAVGLDAAEETLLALGGERVPLAAAAAGLLIVAVGLDGLPRAVDQSAGFELGEKWVQNARGKHDLVVGVRGDLLGNGVAVEGIVGKNGEDDELGIIGSEFGGAHWRSRERGSGDAE